MSKHTPGPWGVAGNGTMVVTPPVETARDLVKTGQFPVTSIRIAITENQNYIPQKMAKANAHLIAAAPELLDACREMAQAMRDYEMDVDVDPPNTHREMMQRARSVIAKAEGTTNE